MNLAQIDDWADDELAGHLAIAHGIVAGRLTKKVRAALGLDAGHNPAQTVS